MIRWSPPSIECTTTITLPRRSAPTVTKRRSSKCDSPGFRRVPNHPHMRILYISTRRASRGHFRRIRTSRDRPGCARHAPLTPARRAPGGKSRRGANRCEARHGARVARVRHHQEPDAPRSLLVDRGQLVIDDRPLRRDVPRAQAFVQAVRLVAVPIQTPVLTTRPLQEYEGGKRRSKRISQCMRPIGAAPDAEGAKRMPRQAMCVDLVSAEGGMRFRLGADPT